VTGSSFQRAVNRSTKPGGASYNAAEKGLWRIRGLFYCLLSCESLEHAKRMDRGGQTMKFSMPELDYDFVPEGEFDEFGDRAVRAKVAHSYVENGVEHIVIENFHKWRTYTKQLSRNRDARMLERGEIDERGLIRKNDVFSGVDFSKVRIVAIGDRRYEDID